MNISNLRLPLAALSIMTVTAVAAEEIELALLQCVPVVETVNNSAVPPICPVVRNGRVVIEDCTCDPGFELARLTDPADIGVAAVSTTPN